MPDASLNNLPAELQLKIVGHLQSAPRSQTHVHHKPHKDLFKNPQAPLKALSATCRHWRQLLVQSLMTNLVLDLNQILLPLPTPATYDGVIKLQEAMQEGMEKVRSFCDTVNALRQSPRPRPSLLVHYSQPEGATDETEWGNSAILDVWITLVKRLEPGRIVILADNSYLRWLLGGRCVSRQDHWIREYLYILELDRPDFQDNASSNSRSDNHGLGNGGRGYDDILEGSLLSLRSWSRIGLNDGNKLQIVTSRFRRPPRPTLVADIFPQGYEASRPRSHAYLRDAMSWVDNFTMTAMNPTLGFDGIMGQLQLRPSWGVWRWQFVRVLSLRLLKESLDFDPVTMPDNDRTSWPAVIHRVTCAYSSLRCRVLRDMGGPHWCLRRIVCEDDATISTWQGEREFFENSVSAKIAELGMDPTRKNLSQWGRVWEIDPSSAAKLTVHD